MSDIVICRASAISRKAFQNPASRLTLVLWPATTIERLTTGDFMFPEQEAIDADRQRARPSRGVSFQAAARFFRGRARCDFPPQVSVARVGPQVCAPF